MKKKIILLLLVIGFAVGLMSCRSTQKCPAYDNIEKFQIDRP